MITTQEIGQSEEPVLAKIDELHKHSDEGSKVIPADPKAVAEYLADILSELGDLAKGAEFTFLAYLIQVAVEEAKIQAQEAKKD